MRKVCIVSTCAFTAAFAAFCDTAVWLESGTGGWSSPDRWVDGKVPVPSVASPWTVTIPDCANAVVTDADKEYFEALGQLNINSNAVLTVTNDADLALSCPLTGGIEMRIVKLGTGTLALKYTQTKYQFNTEKAGSRWEVYDGALATDSCGLAGPIEFRCPVGVWAPGVFRLDTACQVQLRGLYGDGTVEIPSSLGEPLVFAQNQAGSPNDFSGMFKTDNTSYKFIFNGAYQKISDPDVAGSLKSPEIGGGARLALTAFPDTLQFRKSGTSELEYIGNGQSVGGKISYVNNVCHGKLNAGPDGDVKFTTKFILNASKMCVFELTGENRTASEFAGTVYYSSDEEVCSGYVKKTGSGTWRIISNVLKNNGTVGVESGRLEYMKIAERGTDCSLGTANITHSEYTGAKNDDNAKHYACLIGNGETDLENFPVLAYVGTGSATIEERAVAVRGVGGFASENAALDWTGFYSDQEGENVLVLSGAAEGCIARSVTNGVGVLSVMKTGAGSWTLDGNVDFSGGISVKEGTLTLNLDAGETDFVKMASVSSVAVAEGATLVSDKQVPVSAIVFDSSEGAGTIDGFSFPETGRLEIKGKGTDLEPVGSVTIPYEFKNCKDAANISKWTLSMDGEDVKADEFLITVGASGIVAKYLPPGFQIIIR